MMMNGRKGRSQGILKHRVPLISLIMSLELQAQTASGDGTVRGLRNVLAVGGLRNGLRKDGGGEPKAIASILL